MRHRGQTISGRRKNTPNPPINPPERSAAAGEHRLGEPVFDHDGPSVRQEEEADSPIMHVVIEYTGCRRDGCDAADRVNHLYTMDGMSDDLKRCVRRAAEFEAMFDSADMQQFSREDLMAEYVADNAELADYDEVPILTVRFGEDTYGYWYPTTQDVREEASGSCYGRVDEATRLGI